MVPYDGCKRTDVALLVIGDGSLRVIVFVGLAASDLVPTPKGGQTPAILLPVLIGTAVCLAGEPLEMSKGPDLELFCLGAHISSLGTGVSGVYADQSATNKSTSIF